MQVLGYIIYWMLFWLFLGMIGSGTIYRNKLDASTPAGIAAYVLLFGPFALLFVIVVGFFAAIEELSK